jgi:hypothetical protein
MRYIYSTNDDYLKVAKLSSYQKSTIDEYIKQLGKDDTGLETIVAEDGSLSDSLMGISKNGIHNLLEKPYIMVWDDVSRSYKKEEMDIEKVLKQNDFYLSNKHKKPDVLEKEQISAEFEKSKETVLKILNSLDGMIKFKPKLRLLASRNGGGWPFQPEIYLKLLDPDISKSENVAAIDSPLITNTPETKGGTLYSRFATDNFLLEDGPASIRKMINNDPSNQLNKIAGYLDTYYNESTGHFEAGSRATLARLLDDLPGVTYPELPIDIENVRYNEFYGQPGLQDQRGDWSLEENSADALTLYVHDGNKNLFGPMFLRNFKSNTREDIAFDTKEKIKLINRTPSSFVRGEVIMAFYIDGEWIPVKLPEGDGQPPSLKIEKWSFTKIMMNYDSYFRDARWVEWKSGNDSLKAYDILYTPDSYLQKIRNKFYKNLDGLSTSHPFAFLNIPSGLEPKDYDINPSKEYIQSTIFDQVHENYGGKQEKNLIGRTNFYDRQRDPNWDHDNDMYDMIGFWGPVFKEGFLTQEVQVLENKILNITGSGNPFGVRRFFRPIFSTGSFAGAPNKTISAFKGQNNMNHPEKAKRVSFFDPYNIPAELGLLAPFGYNGIGGPIDLLFNTLYFLSDDAENNMFARLAEIQNPLNRFSWLNNGEGPLYGLTPTKPNEIDFVPLSAEMVASYWVNHQVPEFLNLTPKNAIPPIARFLGAFNEESGSSTNWSKEEPIHSFLVDNNIDYFLYTSLSVLINPPAPLPQTLRYWIFIPKSRRVTGGNTATLNTIWGGGDLNSSLVGIISAKCTTRLSGPTHRIRFNLDQFFGLPLQLQALPGAGGNLFVIGNLIFGDNNNPFGARTVDTPRWGRSSNNIQDFNITALHIQIYDAWPEEQTIVDPRFFAVMHFNPGIINSKSDENKIETSVDMRIPTDKQGMYPSDEQIKNRTLFNFKIEDIQLDMNEWKVNYNRRGQLLSLGGFKYLKPYLSVSKVTPPEGSESSSDGSSPDGRYGSQGLIVIKKDNEYNIENGSINFLNEGDIILFGLDEENSGKTIIVKIKEYVVKYQELVDLGPERRLPVTLLTDRNENGKPFGANAKTPGVVDRLKTQLIEFPTKSDSGRYDIFFHFHNDITHTIHGQYTGFPARQQHVGVEITTE